LTVLISAYNIGHRRGVDATTIAYEKKEAAAKDLALKVQAGRQDTVNKASAEGADRKETIRTVYVPIEKKVIQYVQTPAASTPCLDDAGGMLANEAIDAANNAIAAASK